MKNSKNYNRFILFGNKPVCIYGNKKIKLNMNGGKNFIKRLVKWFLNKFHTAAIQSG
ncbi:MAG: hypothetical protein ABIQ40_16655 [Bacteroidia bacterium]